VKKPVIFLSTCEFSGDMHGAVLLNEIKKLVPEAVFYGVGGKQMAAAGMEVIFDPTNRSTIGFTEVIKSLRKIPRLFKEIGTQWDERRPDLMIWLDSGGFNLPLAKEAKKRGIPVVCMFSPSAWGYGEDRAVKLAERVELLLAVLPFEEAFYRKFGAKVTHVGHPLLDRVGSPEPAEFRKRIGLAAHQKLVALLPGSRRQEILRLLPAMLEAAQELNRDLAIKWVLPLAASIDRSCLESVTNQYQIDLEIITEGTYDLLAAADGAIIASGTATLEAAILNTPMVVIYSTSKLSFFIYKCLESKEHKAKPFLIGLPNLISGQEIVPELIQENLTAPNIASRLRRILTDAQYNAELRGQLQTVKEKIGPTGVMARAAKEIVRLLPNG
jgi:lipid-A-disaccharide synthase